MEEQQTNTSVPEQEATTIGMFLKYTRLKQKKSIESVSEALCIRKIYIKALEEDDYETLPPIPYGVGFARSYAAYLGLNAQRIAQIYKQQAFPQKEKNVQAVVTEHTALTIPKKKQIYIGLIAIILLYVLWLSGRSLADKNTASKVQNAEPIAVVDISPVNEEPDEEIIQIISETEDVATDTENADKTADNTQVITLETNYTEDQPVAAPKDTITLKLKGPSWLELKDKQKVYLSGIKDKGFEFNTDYVEGMILSLGKYYNVDVYINGVLTTVAGPKKQTNIHLDQFIKH